MISITHCFFFFKAILEFWKRTGGRSAYFLAEAVYDLLKTLWIRNVIINMIVSWEILCSVDLLFRVFSAFFNKSLYTVPFMYLLIHHSLKLQWLSEKPFCFCNVYHLQLNVCILEYSYWSGDLSNRKRVWRFASPIPYLSFYDSLSCHSIMQWLLFQFRRCVCAVWDDERNWRFSIVSILECLFKFRSGDSIFRSDCRLKCFRKVFS